MLVFLTIRQGPLKQIVEKGQKWPKMAKNGLYHESRKVEKRSATPIKLFLVDLL